MATASGYSARVALTLVVDGVQLALSHVGPSTVVIRDECEPSPPCNAELIIQVEDSVQTSTVFLMNGISGPREPVEYI